MPPGNCHGLAPSQSLHGLRAHSCAFLRFQLQHPMRSAQNHPPILRTFTGWLAGRLVGQQADLLAYAT
jgi:hypothetical protein